MSQACRINNDGLRLFESRSVNRINQLTFYVALKGAQCLTRIYRRLL
jgi:hypothetical protein